ncbi:MAG: ATP-binding cassette domain-containing protein [Magnetococcales bacterium]|nr:ATP-binding cassette domain-containing protein [Magnetococcales bacterium]NGZ07403.1 ATP-binding cassette domain-containing protein [Magnetococcales bacterium]
MAGRARALLRESLFRNKGVWRDVVITSFIINILNLAIAMFTMQVIDRVVRNAGFQTLKVLTVGVLIAIGVELLLRHIRGKLIARETIRTDFELSDWFFRRALGIRLESRPASLGTFAAQIKNLDQVRRFISSAPMFLLVDLPFTFLFLLVVWALGGTLVVVPVVALFCMLMVTRLFRKVLDEPVAQNQVLENQKSGTLVESVGGIDSIKACGAEKSLIERWSGLEVQGGAEEYRINHLSAISHHIIGLLQRLFRVSLVVYGAYMVVEGQLTLGGLIACKIIGNKALGNIAQIPTLQLQWSSAKVALSKLEQMIGLPNELDEEPSQLRPTALEGSVRLEGVRFFYGQNSRPALDLTPAPPITITAGERIGVIGPIGSGKSTLLKIASGLWRPRDGTALLGGVDMSMIVPDALRQFVAYMPQDVRLIKGTLRENLLFGMDDPGDDAILEAAKESGLIDLIYGHTMGLALPINEGGSGISGGQRQLVALTRILLLRPKVLLMDEPTASMDTETEARVVAILDRLAKSGVTLLISTHKSAMLPILDRLLVIKNGRLLMDGKREAVMARLAPSGQSASQPLQPQQEVRK